MSRQASGILFIVIALILFGGPSLVPLLEGARANFSHGTFYRLMALLHFLPGVGVIFLVLGIYRLATKGKADDGGST